VVVLSFSKCEVVNVVIVVVDTDVSVGATDASQSGKMARTASEK